MSEHDAALSFRDRVRIRLFVVGIGLRLFLRIPLRREWIVLRELHANLTEAAQAGSASIAIRNMGRRRDLIAGYIEGQRGHVDYAFGIIGALVAIEVFAATRYATATALGVGAAGAGGWRSSIYHGSLFDVGAILWEGTLEPAVLSSGRFLDNQDIVVGIVGFVVGSQVWRLAGLRRWVSSLTVVLCSALVAMLLASQLSMGNLSLRTLTSRRHDSDLGLTAQIPFSDGDFPREWVEMQVSDDGGPYIPRATAMSHDAAAPSAAMRTFDDCVGRSHDIPQGELAGYSQLAVPRHTAVTTSANLFDNAEDARAQVVPLRVPSYHECLKRLAIDTPGDETIISSGAIDGVELRADEVGYRLVSTLEVDGVEQTKTTDVITLYSGRMASQVMFEGYGSAVSPDFENTYLAKFRNRTTGAALLLEGRS